MFGIIKKKNNYEEEMYKSVGKKVIDKIKYDLKEEAKQYLEDNDLTPLNLDAFYDFDSQVWVEFLESTNLELMYWFEFKDNDFEVVIQEV